jgi:cobalamin biosynthesis protein CobT
LAASPKQKWTEEGLLKLYHLKTISNKDGYQYLTTNQKYFPHHTDLQLRYQYEKRISKAMIKKYNNMSEVEREELIKHKEPFVARALPSNKITKQYKVKRIYSRKAKSNRAAKATRKSVRKTKPTLRYTEEKENAETKPSTPVWLEQTGRLTRGMQKRLEEFLGCTSVIDIKAEPVEPEACTETTTEGATQEQHAKDGDSAADTMEVDKAITQETVQDDQGKKTKDQEEAQNETKQETMEEEVEEQDLMEEIETIEKQQDIKNEEEDERVPETPASYFESAQVLTPVHMEPVSEYPYFIESLSDEETHKLEENDERNKLSFYETRTGIPLTVEYVQEYDFDPTEWVPEYVDDRACKVETSFVQEESMDYFETVFEIKQEPENQLYSAPFFD